MQVDHIRNDFVHIPFSTSVQEGGSFSVAEGVNFGFSRTFDEVGRFPAWNDREFPGKRRPVCRVAAPHHRKCGRTPSGLPISLNRCANITSKPCGVRCRRERPDNALPPRHGNRARVHRPQCQGRAARRRRATRGESDWYLHPGVSTTALDRSSRLSIRVGRNRAYKPEAPAKGLLESISINALRWRFRLVVSDFPGIVCILDGDRYGAGELGLAQELAEGK